MPEIRKFMNRSLFPKLFGAVCLSAIVAGIGCSHPPAVEVPKPFQATRLDMKIAGQEVVVLKNEQGGRGEQPQIIEAHLLPSRGFNIYQIRAYIPGRGTVDLFASPPLEEAKIRFENADDTFGNESFKIGGAILLPYANRIRGKYIPKSDEIETQILDKTVRLPANWQGQRPNAEKHAMHGLILKSEFENLALESTSERASVTGVLRAGDFDGHWLSETLVTVTAYIYNNRFGFTVIAKNTGKDPLPVGIGWHPYLNIASGDRSQARLKIPASQRALVNNYDDVFPTGEIVKTKGTPYDFTTPTALKKLFLDDTFIGLNREPNQSSVAELQDSASGYGIRMIALSPEINAYQVYAPIDKSFVALEPQFNVGDPYGKIWPKGFDNGMVVLQPGEAATYAVEVEVFKVNPGK